MYNVFNILWKGFLKPLLDRKERKYLQSTQDQKPSIYDQDAFPPKEKKTKVLLVKIINAPTSTEKGITYTDQTGRFPYASSRGHNYIMTLYDYDASFAMDFAD